jgi:hypothetical protein
MLIRRVSIIGFRRSTVSLKIKVLEISNTPSVQFEARGESLSRPSDPSTLFSGLTDAIE